MKMKFKIIFFAVGAFFVATALAFIIKAKLGSDPLTSFLQVVNVLTDGVLSVSMVLLICNTIFLLIHLAYFKNIRFVIVAFITALGVSGVLQLWQMALSSLPDTEIWQQIIYFMIGFLFLSFGIACAQKSAFQKMAFEGFQEVIATATKKNINLIRVFVEVGFVILSATLFLATGNQSEMKSAIFVGTIIMMFGTGPFIELFYRTILRGEKLK